MLYRHPVANPVILRDFMACPEEYKKWGFPGHEGVDYQADTGEPVYACSPGSVYRVEKSASAHPYGKHVRISHQITLPLEGGQRSRSAAGALRAERSEEEGQGEGGSSSTEEATIVTVKTIYAHLSQVNVSPGQTIGVGQALGAVGSTGNSSCPHLHLTVKAEGITAADYAPGFDPSLHIVNPWHFLPEIIPSPLRERGRGEGENDDESESSSELEPATSSPIARGRVLVELLNVRTLPSTAAPIVATLAGDDSFDVLRLSASECWALTPRGWVALTYDSSFLATLLPQSLGEGREGD